MKHQSFLPFLALILVLNLSSCASRSTVQSRIAAYPDYFDKLSPKHKELVMQNRVTEGMSKEAVYLAWGKADEIKRSSRNQRVTETWVYYNYKPIYTRGVGVGYGYGYGGSRYYRNRYCGPWGYDTYYGSYDTAVTYQPYVGAKVEFEKDRVAFWETARQ